MLSVAYFVLGVLLVIMAISVFAGVMRPRGPKHDYQDMIEISSLDQLPNVPFVLMIYSPKCGHCSMAMPEFEAAGRDLKGKVQFARMQGQFVQPEFAQRMQIRGVPYIFGKSVEKPVQFSGPRSKDAFVKFAQSIQ